MKSRSTGFTLVELLVVITIIGILVALLLPAVQAAKESGRQAQCQSNMKMIGAAFIQHAATHGYFPTGGWGWSWHSDPDRGFSLKQPGGWAYNILPYIDQNDLRLMGAVGWDYKANGTTSYGTVSSTVADSTSLTYMSNPSNTVSPKYPRTSPTGASGPYLTKAEAMTLAVMTAVPPLYCPSRRAAKTYPYTSTSDISPGYWMPQNPFTLPPGYTWTPEPPVGKTDYAANGGNWPVTSQYSSEVWGVTNSGFSGQLGMWPPFFASTSESSTTSTQITQGNGMSAYSGGPSSLSIGDSLPLLKGYQGSQNPSGWTGEPCPPMSTDPNNGSMVVWPPPPQYPPMVPPSPSNPNPTQTVPQMPTGYSSPANMCWPDWQKFANGISYLRSEVTPGMVMDGLSNTILAGEKSVDPVNLGSALDTRDAFTGHDWTTICYTSTGYLPVQDVPSASFTWHFGSAHPGGCFAVFGDGAVHKISYGVDQYAWFRMGSRNGTKSVALNKPSGTSPVGYNALTTTADINWRPPLVDSSPNPNVDHAPFDSSKFDY